MSARGRARKRALDVLFEADSRGLGVLDVLASRRTTSEQDLNPYTITLVEGVTSHRDRIDELLTTYSSGWTLDRMPIVDRNVLRLGTFELLWCNDIPDGVAISEAVNLAQQLSTDDSPAFVNGLLARLLELKPKLSLEDY